MTIPFYSIVRRHMKRTSPGSFVSVVDASMLPAGVIQPGESLVGLYRNPPPWEQTLIAFTDNALYIIDEQRSERIGVEDIVDYERPTSKTDVTGVRVLTRDGFRFVRVAGQFGPNGNQKDAFSFTMLLRALLPPTPDGARVHKPTGDEVSGS
jgi:hypothetical protein